MKMAGKCNKNITKWDYMKEYSERAEISLNGIFYLAVKLLSKTFRLRQKLHNCWNCWYLSFPRYSTVIVYVIILEYSFLIILLNLPVVFFAIASNCFCKFLYLPEYSGKYCVVRILCFHQLSNYTNYDVGTILIK